MVKRIFQISIIALLCFTVSANASNKVVQYKLQVVKEYPHDVTSYTQGLFFYNDALYESTGLNGLSTFRKVDMTSGKFLRRLNFNKKYFIEGSVIINNEIYLLTWQNNVAFEFDLTTFKYKATYSYPREGWGLTTDGTNLIASNGSSDLYFMDTKFNVQKVVTVKLNGHPMNYLNELEYIDGKIYANVYTTDLILIIDPDSGDVEGIVDCTGLLPSSLKDKNTDVLNGIAYDPEAKKLYLTGKNWPRMYEVKLVASQSKR
jgi:glutamine cyclotransferase